MSNFRPRDKLGVEVFLSFDDDQDARLVGRDLVLDIASRLRREAITPLPDGDQHVVLQHVTSVDADQLV